MCAIGGAVSSWLANSAALANQRGVTLSGVEPGDDVFAYLLRQRGGFDQTLYQQIIGAANEYKEGDEILGVAAADAASRERARQLLSRTRLGDLDAHPLFQDELYQRLQHDVDPDAARSTASWTLGQLRSFLLERSEDEDQGRAARAVQRRDRLRGQADVQRRFDPRRSQGVPSACRAAASGRGATWALASSPIRRPTTSTTSAGRSSTAGRTPWATSCSAAIRSPAMPPSVAAIEAGLLDLIRTFELDDVLPHCVLAHVDVQAEVEALAPGTTGIWFQSLAGSTAANQTFDLTTDKMLAHAARRTGKYGLYFETGQGADFTNGHGQGTDMVIHESRKYGFARLLKCAVAEAQRRAGRDAGALGARERRRRFHRPGSVSHSRAAGPLLPGRHRDGQAARA